MKPTCRSFRDRLGDAAEGRGDADVLAHLAECPRCSARVARFCAVLDASKFPIESAPASLILAVKRMMPSQVRRSVARLVSTSLLAGARAEGEDFQAVFSDGDVTVRILATHLDEGWELLGRLPEGDWQVRANGVVEKEDGGFRVVVQDLDAIDLTLQLGDYELAIPSLTAEASDDRS